jgi:hypothetical protein
MRTRTPLRSNQTNLGRRELDDILEQDYVNQGRTCLCTDERMMLHYNLLDP